MIGTGLLKGNVSVIVGELYAKDDIRRDAGFSIFYMGINLGAFIAPLVCGYLGQQVSWHVGFAAAGVGMTLGVIQYVLGSKNLGDAGLLPGARRVAGGRRAAAPQRGAGRRRRWSLLLVVFGVGASTGAIPITARQVADARRRACSWLIVVVFFGWLFIEQQLDARRAQEALRRSACCSSRRRSSGRCSSRPDRR